MLNMSKGLEMLKETAIQIVEAIYGKEEPVRNNKINELLETIQFKCIEKELKALEIIKKKQVDISSLNCSNTLTQYNVKENGFISLTKEEFDLLKEVLL